MIISIKDVDLNTIDGVIFDLDGTVYDKRFLPLRLAIGTAAMGRLSALISERLTRKAIRGRYFGSKEAFYDAFFTRMGLGIPPLARRAREWYANRYWPLMLRTIEAHYRVRPWIVQLMRDLQAAGKKIAVYSDYEDSAKRLELLGLDLSLVDVAISSPDLGGTKPCKEAILGVAAALGVAPERCLVIGDSRKADGRAAAAIAAQFILCQRK